MGTGVNMRLEEEIEFVHLTISGAIDAENYTYAARDFGVGIIALLQDTRMALDHPHWKM